MLAGLVALAGTGLAGCRTTRPVSRSPRPFVLVHGAWHGGWAWEPVVPILEAAGHRVNAPTLTGLGERADELTPDIGLDHHIADIERAILAADLDDIVLVGHSYGGMVITGVADRMRDRIAHAVYVDAAIPRDGDSMITQGEGRDEQAIAAARARLEALVGPDNAMATLPVAVFGIPEDHPRADWVRERLTPHPFRTWTDPLRLENGGSDGLPRTYIHCSDPPLDPATGPAKAARLAADPGWTFRDIATGHDAMVTDPDGLAALLLEAA